MYLSIWCLLHMSICRSRCTVLLINLCQPPVERVLVGLEIVLHSITSQTRKQLLQAALKSSRRRGRTINKRLFYQNWMEFLYHRNNKNGTEGL